MKRCYLLILLVAVFITHARTTAARQEEDRIIAGDHLMRLWDAVRLGKVVIENRELRSLILERHLSAILIPKNQPRGKRIIRKCYKVQTVFNVPDAELRESDFSQLLDYAKDGAFKRAQAIREAVDLYDSARLATATAELKDYLEQQEPAKREASRRFVGALLADVSLGQAEVADYVNEYHAFMEKEKRTEEKWARFVKPGQPPTARDDSLAVVSRMPTSYWQRQLPEELSPTASFMHHSAYQANTSYLAELFNESHPLRMQVDAASPYIFRGTPSFERRFNYATASNWRDGQPSTACNPNLSPSACRPLRLGLRFEF